MNGGHETKLCATCGRIRAYVPDDRYCVVCGHETLASQCACGRPFDYALDEPPQGGLHCPRCGRNLRDRREEAGLE